MHIDFPAIWSWITVIVPWVTGFSSWLKSGLETIKTGQEIAKTSKELLEKKGEDDHAVERVKANAELLRSYAWVGIIDYLVWLTKAMVFFVPYLLWWIVVLRWLERKLGDKR